MKPLISFLSIFLTLSLLVSAATAAVVLDPNDVSWTTDQNVVTFQLPFYNDGPLPSELQSGELFAQEYGAFLPNIMSIGTFDIPSIPPDSFFDVFVEIPYDQLPPSAEERFDWDGPLKNAVCAKDWHWDGNVDVIWGPPGTPPVQSHIGTIQVCPGYGGSYIHLVTACNGNTTWNFTGVCAGFTASLLDEAFFNAPAVLLPGFTGWIAITAATGTPLGTICCLTLNLTCNNIPVPVKLCVTACDCEPIKTENRAWGGIKSLYR
jgi:hypothetical protein